MKKLVKKGFTLVELMIVVAIIGNLAAIAIPNFIRFQARSKQSEAKTNLKAIFTGQKSRFGERDAYSPFLGDIGFSPERGNRYAYDLGGTEPTVTDANVILGRLNPAYFLGGEMGLDVEGAKDAIRERIAAGGLDDTKELVESLAQEFEMIDIAAAAVAMANESADKGGVADVPVVEERQSRSYDAPRDDRGGYDRAPRPASRTPRDEGPMTLLRISVGKDDSIRPADLVGAIAGEAKIPSGVIGAIKIHDDYSLVEIPDEHAERVITALKRTQIRGHKVTVQSKPASGR